VFNISRGKRKAVKTTIHHAHAPIDEIMKYLFGVSKETLINMLNSLFNQNFNADNSEITQTNAEFVDENFDITRGDLFYLVTEKSKPYNLHIELQTRPDGYMTIRLLEYDIKKAAEIQRLESKSEEKIYVLPKSIVIHVEGSKSVPDCYESKIVDIKDDGSKEIIHRVIPVIKYWKLTDKDLIEKRLYPLLPLQIFLLRGKLKKFAKEKDSEDKRKVIKEIKDLTEKIIIEVKNLAQENKINKDDDDRIITALNRLIKYLNKQYNFDENLNQEVDTVIKSVFTTLKEEGKMEVAEKMILKNEPLEKIIEYSELPEKKIRELAKKLSKELITN
jgi:hypothetical protein